MPQSDQGKQDPARSTNGAAGLAPSISLPKGGGAIRGMGEKFAANPVTGTGSTSVPIATSPGRSGFGPQLSLGYDSGAGNEPFGFGWSLSLPSITRKTDKGLPRYLDAQESDVFILSGAEDLVPVYRQDADGAWVRDAQGNLVVHEDERDGYCVRRYRPRIEGLFARIERWTNRNKPEDTFWRSISKDNITTWYGKTAESRIADPADAARIFSWLICQSYDDQGNAIVYEYAGENDDQVDRAQANERHRVRTANRYLKRIKYGNRVPNRDEAWQAGDPVKLPDDTWMFEVVFDYGEGHYTEDAPDAQERVFARAQLDSAPGSQRPVRQDPFSTYRAGFEVRTYRLCRRVLMFHHFSEELGIADCLVRSTEFAYAESPIASFITGVTQSGYVRQPDPPHENRYLKKSLPPVEFEYSQVPSPKELAQQPIREVDAESLQNLPAGLDGASYEWMDLDGEGTSGILTEQADGWYYKRNLSANHQVREDGHEVTLARFGPIEQVASKPNGSLTRGAQFLDLAGDGQADLVQMEDSARGFYERTEDARWTPFQPFTSWPEVNTRDPDTRFVDLTGDGHADILITEGEALTWYPSLAEAGFGPAVRVSLPLDEEKGPRLVFADGEQAIYLADLSGDGLSDLARIRNGEVCYWPNLGYGRFGAKVTMDRAPWFDAPDQFDQRRIRLADSDGSGTTDILYLRRDGVQIYFNQSGNGWSEAVALPQFPPIDNISSAQALDLLGNGTACLVWSSALPGAARRPLRYLALMDDKPHLMVGMKNNLGAETRVRYAPSTKFYLADKAAGQPWITRLPFPVHVVERVETYDHISRNRFVTRYTYHHGFFDGVEREFRGFGRVEQLDTEELAALTGSGALPEAANLDAASHVPPVLTKTWFHTGVFVGRDHVSDFFAGLLDANDQGEYYRESGLDDTQAQALLLPDTVLPDGLTAEEEREACRALKGAMLRQEVYALDGTDKAEHPYSVAEQNFTIRPLQPKGDNPFAVFFTHAREAISYHYERQLVPVLNGQIVDEVTAASNPNTQRLPDPRVQHALTLEVDEFGNVIKSASIGYGRRRPDGQLSDEDQKKQTQRLIIYTENRVTNAIDTADDYRTPLPAETRTYELTDLKPENDAERFSFDQWTRNAFSLPATAVEIPYEHAADHSSHQKRLIEQVRSLYRKDDLSALLPLGELEPLALPGESYKLAFTPGLLDQVYVRSGQKLLPANPADVLKGGGADRGGYVLSQDSKAAEFFPSSDPDNHWWIPSGRVFYSPTANDLPTSELAFARAHFFLPHRTRDPFHTEAASTESFVGYDGHTLLMVETRDALRNTVQAQNDYRVLAPYLMTDPNDNRSQVAFDALGMVAGSAVMGKQNEPDGQPKGDVLENFVPDPTLADLTAFIEQPRRPSAVPEESEATDIVRDLLKNATTRIVYDLDRFRRLGEPPFAATIARESHMRDLDPGEQAKLQVSFSYSDGFGREIQKKIQAEPGPLVEGGPEVGPRWVGSGWTVFNNKGKPVRQYEPFFTGTHQFEFGVEVGVSPVLFYDPAERVVATLHPNHTWEKVVFDPWRQETSDVNDTVLAADPKSDPDVGDFFRSLLDADYLPTWHALRTDPAHAAAFAALYPDAADRANETRAAAKAAAYADTPTTTHFDTLGRPFLTAAHNKVVCPGHKLDGTEDKFHTRVELDIEGNQRTVQDERRLPVNGLPVGPLEQRIVMRYDYDMLGKPIHQASMEAGERWMLNDVSGNPIRAFDSRGHNFSTTYDVLRRTIERTVLGTTADSDPRTRLPNPLLVDKIEYGEPPLNATPAQEEESQRLNLRTRILRHRDPAGIATSARLDANGSPVEAYDFKGNPLRSTRQLVSDYKAIPDWSQNPPLDAETFESSTRYDALNRPIQSVAPHSSLPRPGHPNKLNVIQPVFNEANLLERMDVWLERAAEPADLLDPNAETPSPVGVDDIDYDARGQRLRIDYRNGASTFYRYDPLTFRLTRLYTRRGAAFTADCDNPTPPPPTIAATDEPLPGRACGLQNLHYTYDPAGNITHIQDDAQQTIFFDNHVVEPSSDYTYDAVYRLIEARGREHLGQAGAQPTPPDAFNRFHTGQPHPGDGQAMGTYTERYIYDFVGNFQAMTHFSSNPTLADWTRTYEYREDSQLEQGKVSNRLTSTAILGVNEVYSKDGDGYDGHGNMLKMPHLPLMAWDYRDQLQATSKQVVTNGGTPEITYYIYDASGQRARKVTERQADPGQPPITKEERLYLDGFEVFRQYSGSGNGVTLERETLHLMDDKQRITLIETKTIEAQSPNSAFHPLIRFQLGNHLGSASLELDGEGKIISYEEYFPYGSTSYQAVRSQTETPKRYRYTGMERDEESGLSYHGTRYYAPWSGRWVTCDPIGIDGGINLYQYVKDAPGNMSDREGNSPVHVVHVQGDYEPGNRPMFDYDNMTMESVDSQKIRSSPEYIDNAVTNINTGSYNVWELTLISYRLTLTDKTSFNVPANKLDYSGQNIATGYFRLGGIIYPVNASGFTFNTFDTPRILKYAIIWNAQMSQVAFEANNTRLFYGYLVNAFAQSIAQLGHYASSMPGLENFFSSVANRAFRRPGSSRSSIQEGIGASPDEEDFVSRYNEEPGPEGKGNCVRCVASLIDTVDNGNFRKGSSDFEVKAKPLTEKAALEQLMDYTKVTFGRRLEGRLGGPGDYVVFNAFNSRGTPEHVFWARVRPNGQTIFYDPQTGKTVSQQRIGAFTAYQAMYSKKK